MNDHYILSIDQGTTGTTALVLNTKESGKNLIIGKHTEEFPQHYPKMSWVEHDLNEVWQSVVDSVQKALANAKKNMSHFEPKKIVSIGITNQRETTCFFDRHTSKPLRKAIVWQCKRSTPICDEINKDKKLADQISQKTGLVCDPYFSGSKIQWIMEHDEIIRNQLKSGKAIIGTVDTYLIHRLSGGKSFVSEPSNASRTLLYDIHKKKWDDDLLKIFKVPSKDCLAEIQDSVGKFGLTSGLNFLPDGIPITGVLGDQQAALAGQGCFQPGEAKCTYGTGAFLLLQLGKHSPISTKGLLTTVSWSISGELSYAFEGSSFIAGAAIQFLRDNFKFLKSAEDSYSLAQNHSAAPEIYFVPALSGLGAPQWNPKAKGTILGLTRDTSIEQIIRATIEGIAFQVNDLLQTMNLESQQKLQILRVDGGASANELLLRSQANISNLAIERPLLLETTALGAGLFSGLGAGIYSDLNDLKNISVINQRHLPEESFRVNRDPFLKGWNRALKAVHIFSSQ